MSENILRTCSRCDSTVLETYFSKNRKGELYKLCDTCRNRANEATQERRIAQKQYEVENKERQKQNAKLFRDSIKYFETGDTKYYDKRMATYIGNNINPDKKDHYIDFFKSQLKWLEPLTETKD